MQGILSGWGVRIAIIAVIALGAFVLRDRISGNAGDLQVGDCFDEPLGETVIEDVQHHPCNEPHTSEVIFVGDVPGSGDAYPADEDLNAFFDANCVPAYNAYTGRDFSTDTELDIGAFTPTEEGWRSGDREMMCYAIRVDGAPTSTSLKLAP